MAFGEKGSFFNYSDKIDKVVGGTENINKYRFSFITVKEFLHQCQLGRWSIVDKIWST